ncbi:competence protein CoiA family protein [Nanoarchaeota archaeon]
MKKRQLYTARDKAGKLVLIDDIDKGCKGSYLCPYCKKEVVPKMGDRNVWHFAHKEEVCEYLNIKSSDGLSDGKIEVSESASVGTDSIDIGSDSRDFLCVKCKKRFNKSGGLKWEGNEYICRGCFNNL